jgi:hypothetical protein
MVSVHAGWPCCLWGCGKAEHHGGSVWRRKQLTSWQPEVKREESVRLGSPFPLQEHGPHVLSQDSASWRLHPFPVMLQAGDHAFSTRAFGRHSSSIICQCAIYQCTHTHVHTHSSPHVWVWEGENQVCTIWLPSQASPLPSFALSLLRPSLSAVRPQVDSVISAISG